MADDNSECISPVCGIIMPISGSDDFHTAAHWEEVRSVFDEAIYAAGMEPKPVWIAGDTNIIQAKILKNLFENDIVLCDVSTLNPNVMLEFGMRLTTRKPTVVVAEVGTKLPFDTTIIQTEFYDPSLKHSKVKAFVASLTKELELTQASVRSRAYHSFLEHFTFERVEPSTITVSANRAFENKIDNVLHEVTRVHSYVANVDRLLRERERRSGGFNVPYDLPPDEPAAAPSDYRSPHLVGDRVFHQKFGNGTIAEINKNKLEVDFDIAGRKRVMDTFVSLSDEPPG